ncbi:unnamed protein product, partial [Polarella glacialis]
AGALFMSYGPPPHLGGGYHLGGYPQDPNLGVGGYGYNPAPLHGSLPPVLHPSASRPIQQPLTVVATAAAFSGDSNLYPWYR